MELHDHYLSKGQHSSPDLRLLRAMRMLRTEYGYGVWSLGSERSEGSEGSSLSSTRNALGAPLAWSGMQINVGR